MAITASDQFRGVCRITREDFRTLIKAKAAAPVVQERDPGEYWDAIRGYDLDPLFIASIFQHESGMGKNGTATQTHSWGNTRTPNFGATPVGTVPGRTGTFPVWANWLDGCISTAARLASSNYVYAGRNIGQVYTVEPSWAPAGDLNDPAGYLRAVLDFMNTYQSKEQPVPSRKYHVAISMGHHNTDGGNAVEKGQTPILAHAIADACRALGIEVRVVQDEIGMNPNVGLQGVAQKVVDWDKGGWPVDLYLETHTEGAGTAARGAFCIYPDTNGDVDLDAKRVGLDAVQRLTQAIGIPLRGDGTMSERNTGVGAQGYRLGIFLVTEAISDHCTRMIIEFGSHDNPDDLAAVNGHTKQIGDAVAAAYAAEATRLGFTVTSGSTPTPPPADDPNTYTDPVTGFKVIGGMKARWDQLKAALATISAGRGCARR